MERNIRVGIGKSLYDDLTSILKAAMPTQERFNFTMLDCFGVGAPLFEE
jgi:hypothetical protein